MTEVEDSSYNRWLGITRRWWFFAIVIIIQAIPPYATKGVEPETIGELTGYILQNPILYSLTDFFPLFQLLPMLLVLSIIIYRNRASKIFSLYAAFSYLLFAVLQNISVTEEYGVAVVNSNVIMFLTVAVFWAWEAVVGKNKFSVVSRGLKINCRMKSIIHNEFMCPGAD